MDLSIRTLSLDEVALLVDWAADEGWNPGLHDAALFQVADPDGFIGGFIGDELVAGISAVEYGDSFGFIGLYISHPDHRGKGFGKAVWNAGMDRLNGRVIGLDGVPEQQANYRSKGFVEAYGTTRYSGRFAGESVGNVSIRRFEPGDLDAVTAFDRRYFPDDRARFLAGWLRAPHLALAAIDGDAIVGYGVARECREGFKIGPLFAEQDAIATSILAGLADLCDGNVHIDVSDIQAGFQHALAGGGLEPGFVTARMYRGGTPEINLDGVFATTTLELG